MKKINDCYSMMQKIKKNNLKNTKSNNNNVNSKLSKSNNYYVRKQNISNPYSDIKNSITYNCNKSKQQKSRCNTEYSK